MWILFTGENLRALRFKLISVFWTPPTKVIIQVPRFQHVWYGYSGFDQRIIERFYVKKYDAMFYQVIYLNKGPLYVMV